MPTWRIYEAKVLNLMKSKITPSSVLKKLNELDSLDEGKILHQLLSISLIIYISLILYLESKTFAIFWNLHNLFPPHIKVIEEDGCKRRKKYSVTDSQTSFAIVARSNEEMDLKLNLRKIQSKCVQPTLLIVGDEFNVKSIYIYFNGNRYPMKKVLIAIDILYKIFFVFNLKFPDESELFYTFLQTMYYEMKADKSFAKVSVIRDEILNLKII